MLKQRNYKNPRSPKFTKISERQSNEILSSILVRLPIGTVLHNLNKSHVYKSTNIWRWIMFISAT